MYLERQQTEISPRRDMHNLIINKNTKICKYAFVLDYLHKLRENEKEFIIDSLFFHQGNIVTKNFFPSYLRIPNLSTYSFNCPVSSFPAGCEILRAFNNLQLWECRTGIKAFWVKDEPV